MKRVVLLLLALSFCLGALPGRAATPQVYVIDVHGTVWPGLATFVTQQLDDAWRRGASGVILDLDTTRGTEDAAVAIKTAVVARSRDLPIAAYVHDRALGPGTLIAIACKTLALSPGASLGGAAAQGNKADFRGAAEASGRNPDVAAAFVSADGPLPALGVKAGDTLTLTTRQAGGVGYADVVASDTPDVLAKMGLASASLVPVHLDAWTAVALWVSQPWATILILALGLALVIAEMMTLHSWGLAGIIGGVLIVLIFAAYITIGAATWVGVLLFLAGIALMVFEAHLPGHGVWVLAGLVLVASGMFFALGGAQAGALYSTAGALLTALALLVAFFVYLPKSPVWKKIGPADAPDGGGRLRIQRRLHGLSRPRGRLRPRCCVPRARRRSRESASPSSAEGSFIPAGTAVQVVEVAGNRVVVRAA